MPENEKSLRGRIYIYLLGIVLILGAVFLFTTSTFKLNPPSNINEGANDTDMTSEFEKARSFLNATDPQEAIRVYDQMLASSEDEPNTHTLILYKAYALFATGDPVDATEAVELLGNLLSLENVDTLFRSWAITELLQFYYSSQSPAILSNIRELAIFAEHNSLSDQEFLLKAAETAHEIYPTALGKIHLAIPLARELTYTDSQNTELVRSHAEKIEQLTTGSQLLEFEEVFFDTPNHHMSLAHYRGILLSAAVEGGVDPLYSRGQFEDALTIATENPDNTAVQQLSWYTNFYYAADVIEHTASSTDGVLADYLITELTNKLTAAEDISNFETFVRAAHNNPNSNNYRLFVLLGEQSALFKTFLQEKFSLTF